MALVSHPRSQTRLNGLQLLSTKNICTLASIRVHPFSSSQISIKSYLRGFFCFFVCILGESLDQRSGRTQLYSPPRPLAISAISPKSAAPRSLSFHLEHKHLRYTPTLRNNTSSFDSCFSQMSPYCHNSTHQKIVSPPLPNF